MKRATVLILLIFAVLRTHADEAKPQEAKPQDTNAAEAKPQDAKDAKQESRIKHDADGNTVIKLDAATQKLIALKAEPLAASQLAPEIKAYGRVLDPVPLAASMTDLASAQAAYAVSSNELARLKSLSASGNASSRALQSAAAAELHDRLAAQSARDRLVMAWGKWVLEQQDLPTFVQNLTALDNALVRVDLSAGEQLASAPLGARIVSLAGKSADAELLGRAVGVDPTTQGQGILLEVKDNKAQFLVGESVTGFLKTAGDPLNGVTIPRSAIVRADGATWVYVQTADDQFTRKQITLDQIVQDGWFVTNAVAPGDKLVTAGAQTLLSEELKGALGAPSD